MKNLSSSLLVLTSNLIYNMCKLKRRIIKEACPRILKNEKIGTVPKFSRWSNDSRSNNTE